MSGSIGDVQIVGGVVFYASGTSIFSLGGEPTTATTGTAVVSDGSGTSPTQFFFARLGSGSTYGTTGADTLYVADSKATNGTLFKYSWSGTAWTAAGSFTGPDTASGNQLLGVTGIVNGSTATIYFTEGNTSGGTVGDLYKFSDTFAATLSSGTAVTRIANVTSLENFHGVVPAPDDGVGAIGGLGGTTSYAAGKPAAVVAAGATFGDASNFMGGSLTATIAAGGTAADQLGIAAGNNISLTGTSSGNVLYNGNLIGTYTLSTGAAATLSVTFNPPGSEAVGNSAANPVSSAAVQALIQQVAFATTGAGGNRTVSFQVTENGGAKSAVVSQTVAVTAHTPPTISADTGLTVAQSSTTKILAGNLAATSSSDSPANLTWSITTLPTAGTIEKSGAAVSSFTQADINAGLITYVQNGSDTTSDSFAFSVTDAEGASVGGTFAITINAPVLVANAGATLQAGGSVALVSSLLDTSESGKTNSQLIYTIGTAPTSGTLTNTATHATLGAGATFTQTDINNGVITYTNTNAAAASDGFTFTVTDGSTGSTGLRTFSLTIQAPTVSLANATQSVNENGGTFSVTVNLSAATGVAVSVPFTLGGTAVSGTNYSGVTASPLVIPAGQTSATITGTLIDDGKYEPTNATLTVTLGTPMGATLGTTSSDTLTIVQSDPEPTVSLAAATQSVNENGGTFTITVKLSAASGVATTVPFTLGGTAVSGVNYSGVTASPLVIPAGQTTATVTGTLIDDGKYEVTNTTLVVTLGTPMGATLGTTSSDTLTIVESDLPLTAAIAAIPSPRNTPVDSITITFTRPGHRFYRGRSAVDGQWRLEFADRRSDADYQRQHDLDARQPGERDRRERELFDHLVGPGHSGRRGRHATSPGGRFVRGRYDSAHRFDCPRHAEPANPPVTALTITFSEPVSGFSLSNLQLSVNGGANLLTAAQTLTTSDNLTWTLGNLGGLTATGGNYVLTLAPTGIADLAGNALAAGATGSFELRVWQNTANPYDVNANGIVNPIDALVLINYLNAHGFGPLPATFTGPDYLDVNGDGSITPLDALGVINYINRQLLPGAVAGQAAPEVLAGVLASPATVAAEAAVAAPGQSAPAVEPATETTLAIGVAFSATANTPAGSGASGQPAQSVVGLAAAGQPGSAAVAGSTAVSRAPLAAAGVDACFATASSRGRGNSVRWSCGGRSTRRARGLTTPEVWDCLVPGARTSSTLRPGCPWCVQPGSLPAGHGGNCSPTGAAFPCSRPRYVTCTSIDRELRNGLSQTTNRT